MCLYFFSCPWCSFLNNAIQIRAQLLKNDNRKYMCKRLFIAEQASLFHHLHKISMLPAQNPPSEQAIVSSM